MKIFSRVRTPFFDFRVCRLWQPYTQIDPQFLMISHYQRSFMINRCRLEKNHPFRTPIINKRVARDVMNHSFQDWIIFLRIPNVRLVRPDLVFLAGYPTDNLECTFEYRLENLPNIRLNSSLYQGWAGFSAPDIQLAE